MQKAKALGIDPSAPFLVLNLKLEPVRLFFCQYGTSQRFERWRKDDTKFWSFRYIRQNFVNLVFYIISFFPSFKVFAVHGKGRRFVRIQSSAYLMKSVHISKFCGLNRHCYIGGLSHVLLLWSDKEWYCLLLVYEYNTKEKKENH